MSSGTEDSECSSSSTSSSEEEKYKRHKSSKRQKHKDEKKRVKKVKKKSKLHKPKKNHKNKDTKKDEVSKTNSIHDNGHIFGPALPPHLLQKPQIVIGPVLPRELQQEDAKEANEEPNDGQDMFGPMPVNESGMSATQIELEQRALELKLAAIEGRNMSTVEVKTREEWMLELPDVGLKGGLAALATIKRKFHQGKEKPDFSDRSEWTKTPQSEMEKHLKPTTSKQSAEALRKEAEETFERKRDEEQERMARRHKKKHKMEASLVEMHQKKLRKEQKKKAKELLERGEKAERRPFTRDVDLKLNKIDSHQTKQIVAKAKILNTKFSTGQAKYL